ncbi:MAG: NAD(P)H-hydrate dehydratase [Actinobacteria bacterium]|jgi:NAD(P)H-hydrate epimerase|nr:MAG: NAD(P)H-hydrate dehydratase [Actinomycetota bacterium]
MRVLFPHEMAALDRAAIQGGIPSLDLMERAGRYVAEQARDLVVITGGKRISVVAARGNNGGDGFVAARYLASWGAAVKVYLLGGEGELSTDAAANYRRFSQEGGATVRATGSVLKQELPGSDLVIDAIFGTGFHGSAEGETAEAIAAINACATPVLAVDIPSGVEAETGAVSGPAVRAARTVTFAYPKVGLYLYPGAEMVGELVWVDIGIPPCLLDEIVKSEIYVLEEEGVAALIPNRRPDAHKGECGRVFVVAGSAGLTGAAALCSRAALRAGAGVVTLGIAAGLNAIMEVKLTEVMTMPLPDEDGKRLDTGASEVVREAMEGYDVLALGPGLGTAPSTCAVVSELLRSVEKPVVLDADGLNCAARDTGCLSGREYPTVITPHPGELGRLLDRSAGEIRSSRLEAAVESARRFGCVTVLKGANTLVASPQGTVHINPLAMAGLATAGSGDVLTGCIAAFCAQGLEPMDAAICGVFTHGKAAELAAQMIGQVGMVAGDLNSHLPLALSGLLRDKKGGR